MQPKFGVVDWFVEELVGQGDRVVEEMTATPAWAYDLPGNVWVAPAHGRAPGEYLAKLGRSYMETITRPWVERLRDLLTVLESNHKPTVVLLESRSGLHDIAAATVTDLDAEVMLFAVDSPGTWTGYSILFDHWLNQGLARQIRQRLSIVSGLTPELDTEAYLARFRENTWNLFRDRLYDTLEGGGGLGDEISYDLSADNAPHTPFVIHWNRGLAAGTSLRRFASTAVRQAYSPFLQRFDLLHRAATRTLPAKTWDASSTITLVIETGEQRSTHSQDIETVRIALSELPEGTAHGGHPNPADVYRVPSHRKAADPNVALVIGMRGSGKTFLWGALQNPLVRTLLARSDGHLPLNADTEVLPGFGVVEEPDHYPSPDEFRHMAAKVDHRIIWRTVHSWHLTGSDHPLRARDSWVERAQYVAREPQTIARVFRDKDDSLDCRDVYSLMLFDGLDRITSDWPEMFKLIRGLLRHSLDMRSYRRLRTKVFLRSGSGRREEDR